MATRLKHRLSTWLHENHGLAIKEQEEIGAGPAELSLAYLGTVIASKLRKSLNREEAIKLAQQTLQGFGRATLITPQIKENAISALHHLLLECFDISPQLQIHMPDDRTIELIVERQPWLTEVFDGLISSHCRSFQDSVAMVRINLNGYTRFIIQEHGVTREGSVYVPPSRNYARNSMRQVLVVDDDADVRTFAKLIFEQLEWQVTTAQDGRHALAALYQEDFQLVLVDGDMPNLNGPETVMRIRAAEQRNHMPPAFIIGMSANGAELTRSRAIEVGCDLFIEKPLDLDILDQILQAKFGKLVTHKKERLDPLIAPLLPSYIDRRLRELTVLRQAIRQEDQGTLKKLVHKIKGSGSSYGLEAVSSAARQIETQILAENWRDAELALDQLAYCLRQAKEALSHAS